MATEIFRFPEGSIGLATLDAADRAVFLDSTRSSVTLHDPWIQPPRSNEEFDALLLRSQDPSFLSFAVWHLQPKKFVGMIHFSQIFRGAFQSAYLSYWVDAAHQGNGYMEKAMQLAVRLAFNHLHLHRLEANIQPQNLKSIALVKRLGFVKEGFSEKYLQVMGEWRDHERWAIHCEIWPDANFTDSAKPK